MFGKKTHPDTKIFLFAVKIVGSFTLIFAIALFIDLSHLIHWLQNTYAG